MLGLIDSMSLYLGMGSRALVLNILSVFVTLPPAPLS
jgi:hypothetical protein